MKAIMYHYVRSFNTRLPYFSFLHKDDFSRQLDHLAERYTILHPAEVHHSVSRGGDKNGVVLTFDDGLHDHYEHVFPELQKRGLSAIFYVSTGVLNTNKILGVHQLHLLLGKAGGKEVLNVLMQLVTPEMLNQQYVAEFNDRTYRYQQGDDETQLVKRMLNFYISYHYRSQVLDTLMAFFFDDEPELLQNFYLQPAQIREMSNAGMIIGSHTVSHRVMSKLNTFDQVHEIETSMYELEQITGGLHHRTFCYPHGGFHSFTSETESILARNKFAYSFNVEPRDVIASDLQNRPQALPRFDCNMFPHGKIFNSQHFTGHGLA